MNSARDLLKKYKSYKNVLLKKKEKKNTDIDAMLFSTIQIGTKASFG